MDNMKEFTPEQSLEIIARSIEESRERMLKNAGQPLIRWGVLVLATSLAVSALWYFTGSPLWTLLYFLMAIVGFTQEHFMGKKRESVPVGFVGKTIDYVWTTFAIFAMSFPLLLSLFFGFLVFFPPHSGPISIDVPITGFIALVMGFSTTISGFVLKNKWIIAGGIMSGLGGLIADHFIAGGFEILIIAVIAIVGLIIPGLMVNLENRKSCSSR